MRRKALLGLLVGVLVLLGAGVSVASTPPALRTGGPTSVSGTAASSVFTIGYRTVRQVRYADHGTLHYTFMLANDGRLPVQVAGLLTPASEPRLFHHARLTDGDGHRTFSVPARSDVRVTLSLEMSGCETLSARAGSFADTLSLKTSTAGVFAHDLTLRLPEELHTGSPREAFCPNSTAESRPPG